MYVLFPHFWRLYSVHQCEMHSSMPYYSSYVWRLFQIKKGPYPNEIARYKNNSHSILIWICFNWILWAEDELTTIHCSYSFPNCIRRNNAIDEHLHFWIYLFFPSNLSALVPSWSIWLNVFIFSLNRLSFRKLNVIKLKMKKKLYVANARAKNMLFPISIVVVSDTKNERFVNRAHMI